MFAGTHMPPLQNSKSYHLRHSTYLQAMRHDLSGTELILVAKVTTELYACVIIT